MAALFAENRFPFVVHLAGSKPAYGIHWSIRTPYVDSNLVGFTNILEGCRHNGCRHLLFASSSSVYGSNTHMPFSIHDNVDHPLSLYGASKKANELMAHAYAHLFGLPTTGLRFFTVYGPWGRPDMAMWLFASAIMAGQPIKLFNHGNMRRDFTYIDDVVESVVRLVDRAPAGNPKWSSEAPDPGSSAAPWRVYNIGNNNPVELLEVVRFLKKNRQESKARAVANAAGRCSGDICGCRRSHARCRFQAGNADRRRYRSIYRLVSFLPPPVMQTFQLLDK